MPIPQLFMILALVASQAQAGELFVKKSFFSEFAPTIEKFQPLDKGSTVGDYPILPVAEKMQVVFAKVQYSTGVVVPEGRITAFSGKNGKFEVGLEVKANLSQASASDWTDTPCKREDYLWKRSTGGKFQDVNCVSINHITSYFVNPTGAFQQLAVDIRDKGLEIPPTIVRVSFTRYTSNMRRLVYVVDINPELYGIERDATSIWGSNSWYKDFVNRDPKKSLFLERLTKWATDVQDRMNAAFDKDPNAFVGFGLLESYLRPEAVNQQQRTADSDSDVEVKLSKLKSLYEKGLLTEGLYNEQVKAVLGGK